MLRTVGRTLRRLTVLVLAFASADAGNARECWDLYRGFAVQLAYRAVLGGVMTNDDETAVALLSPADGRPALSVRSLAAAAAALTVGGLFFFVGTVLPLLLLAVGLEWLGLSPGWTHVVVVLSEGIRAALMGTRAWQAYAHDHRAFAVLLPPTAPRWTLDYLAAWPRGQQAGSRLLHAVTDIADGTGIELALHCSPQLARFYRRHGFRPVATVGDRQVMLRPPVATVRSRLAVPAVARAAG